MEKNSKKPSVRPSRKNITVSKHKAEKASDPIDALNHLVFDGLKKRDSSTPTAERLREYSSELKEHSLKHQEKSPSSVENNQQMLSNFRDQLSQDIEELRIRFLYLTESVAADKHRYEWLELHTSIPAARWQNVLLEKQLPTLEMIVAACHYLNNGYAHWLIHGWLPEPSEPAYRWKLCAPSEEAFNYFKERRAWLNQMKQEKKIKDETFKSLEIKQEKGKKKSIKK